MCVYTHSKGHTERSRKSTKLHQITESKWQHSSGQHRTLPDVIHHCTSLKIWFSKINNSEIHSLMVFDDLFSWAFSLIKVVMCKWDEQLKGSVMFSFTRKYIRNDKTWVKSLFFYSIEIVQCNSEVWAPHSWCRINFGEIRKQNSLHLMLVHERSDPTHSSWGFGVLIKPRQDLLWVKYMAGKNVQFYKYWHEWSFLYFMALKPGKAEKHRKKVPNILFFFCQEIQPNKANTNSTSQGIRDSQACLLTCSPFMLAKHTQKPHKIIRKY